MAKHKVCNKNDLENGKCKPFEVNGHEVALYHADGEYWATNNFCPHRGGSLGEGELNGTTITCPLHGWMFDVTTGECLNNVGGEVDTYEVSVEGDEVYVELPS